MSPEFSLKQQDVGKGHFLTKNNRTLSTVKVLIIMSNSKVCLHAEDVRQQ